MSQVIVIGGGASGMMAAISCAISGNDVSIFEKNEKLGKKLFITGKGRCNVFNACSKEEFFDSVSSNPKFLYSSYNLFGSLDSNEFFTNIGLKLKTERGNRVFPISDHASDVTKALQSKLNSLDVKINLNSSVKALILKSKSISNKCSNNLNIVSEEKNKDKIKDNSNICSSDILLNNEKNQTSNICSNCNEIEIELNSKSTKQIDFSNYSACGIVLSDNTRIYADKIIIATGGLSYPSTGSTGDGLTLANNLGHNITPCIPSLVGLECKELLCNELSGLSLRNISIRIINNNKTIYTDFGEMLFTHYGISGPVILSASSRIGREINNNNLSVIIDLKPAISETELDQRLIKDIDNNKDKIFKNILPEWLPKSLHNVIINRCQIDENKKLKFLTKEDRKNFIYCIKNFNLNISGLRGFNEAIITKGGVDVREINPKTLESKLISNLYFVGEVLDVDALTGGFNLQIAWSTGYSVGYYLDSNS